jgi:putative NIF3 family GTP cyclohydrolase 1 type 2
MMREQGVDTYITGETNMFTLEAARFYRMNIIDCTHTMSEFPGIKSLVERIKTDHPNLDIVRLNETNIELAHHSLIY